MILTPRTSTARRRKKRRKMGLGRERSYCGKLWAAAAAAAFVRLDLTFPAAVPAYYCGY